jgi:oligosaccharide repeat unit polymerase
MQLWIGSQKLAMASIALLFAGASLLFWGIVASDDRFLLLAVCTAAPAAFLMPVSMLRRGISALDPVALFAIYVIIGTTFGGWFIGFSEGYRRDYLVSGESLPFFTVGAIWICAALIIAGVTNGVFKFRLPAERLFTSRLEAVDPRRLMWVGIAAAGLSIFATFAFVQQTGGLNWSDLAGLSRKRTLALAVEGGETVYGAAGYLRAVAGISLPLALVVLAWSTTRYRNLSLSVKIGVGFLALSALALPFFSSARSDVVMTVAQMLLVVLLFKRISPAVLISAVAVALVVFSGMTSLRFAAQASEEAARSESADQNPVALLGSSGNGLSVVGTSLIIQRVPERMDFMMGSSLFTWMTAPIPRSIWPNKPDVSLGKEVKEQILGLRSIATGRPPGFLGEGYMNFGPLGFFGAAVALGALMRLTWNTFAPLLGKNIGASVYYVMLLQNISVLANANFSQVVVRVIVMTAIYMLVVAVLTWPRGRRTADAQFGGPRVGRA